MLSPLSVPNTGPGPYKRPPPHRLARASPQTHTALQHLQLLWRAGTKDVGGCGRLQCLTWACSRNGLRKSCGGESSCRREVHKLQGSGCFKESSRLFMSPGVDRNRRGSLKRSNQITTVYCWWWIKKYGSTKSRHSHFEPTQNDHRTTTIYISAIPRHSVHSRTLSGDKLYCCDGKSMRALFSCLRPQSSVLKFYIFWTFTIPLWQAVTLQPPCVSHRSHIMTVLTLRLLSRWRDGTGCDTLIMHRIYRGSSAFV